MEQLKESKIESGAHFNNVNAAINFAFTDAEQNNLEPILILDFDGTAYPTLIGSAIRKITNIWHNKSERFELDILDDLLEKMREVGVVVTNRSEKSILNRLFRNEHILSKARNKLEQYEISIYSGLDRQSGKWSFLRENNSWEEFTKEVTNKVNDKSGIYVISDRGSLTMAIDALNIALGTFGRTFLSDRNFCLSLQSYTPTTRIKLVSVNHLLFRLLPEFSYDNKSVDYDSVRNIDESTILDEA